MRRVGILGLFVCAAVSLAYAADGTKPPGTTRKFDGTWSVTLVCADFRDEGSGAKGYTFRFLANVKDGHLEAQYHEPGIPGSLHYTGDILSDGSAMIQANGFTNKSEYTVQQQRTGTPYSYRLRGRFDDDSGTAKRLDLRPCDVTFTRQ